ncbi:hypothetical protein [Rhizobium phage RHph_X2_26]|nr:hypothetical protein [Rhizobium phage RHph_X2_26]
MSKRYQLNAWEMALIDAALRLWAKQADPSETAREQTYALAAKFLAAKSATVTVE